ncbi:hypothetical protein QEH52_17500 [Coraliomargarita sp. SDUM461003]|uniref:NodB homology domain-containing protein n=1 Tax=Thalassobacterium maritimum TaxID=3041265 RepID=A0ABU1B094_9BACT|nr:hypothetical protein [Coraliomargarita sp. SDUM461003]MDQ8209327.1 hypothetical protein [Coraliomargarita sp. SDUM461003]
MSTVHLLALFLVLGSASLWSADADLRFYSYEIVIEDRGHEETLSACPVYDNKEVAFTARWDDSHRNHYRMRKLMEKYGLKGTFFLNHKRGQSFDHEKIKGWDGAFGAHSMTHARLASELSINRMFWEVAEIRAILEAEGEKQSPKESATT